ncbi:MAG: toll/interleukin-1 receptor domain-containing protein [Pseudomonadota bacterium]|nr:toll/interleukin-1 receptor domain-containing protein [Pseudomonadota bacterium]
MPTSSGFDVFLSHNSVDKALVVKLKSLLRERGLRAWLDKDELTPGEPWQPLLEKGVGASATIAACIGPSGMGPWQSEEVELALQDARRLGKRVIPVILPSTPADVEYTGFLDNRTRVDLREGFTAEGLDALEWGITKRKPGPRAARPHNLPRLPWFFGRKAELDVVAHALDHGVRSWGALIDGPGGMGKTSLAIRAAELAAERFDRVVFVSAKARELRPEGERPMTSFVSPAYGAMLRELGAELGIGDEVERSPEAERPKLLHRALRDRPALVIFDNLESLSEADRTAVFGFLDHLPPGSKAIVTSRRRTDVGAKILRLERLDTTAATALVDVLAEDRAALRRATAEERKQLVEETGGNPLLLRWVAGQLGRGKCHTVASALLLLRAAPADNDPLEFIFGDLAREFTEAEAKVLGALTHFTGPAELRHLAELAGLNQAHAQTALEDLAYRALVNADAESRRFVLAPLVGAWLRRARPEVVQETGDRLAEKVYALVVENGYQEHDRFPTIEAEWGVVAAALPVFLAGENGRLQTVCGALDFFLNFSGRWEEQFALSVAAEERAIAASDTLNAGWRAYQAGFTRYLLGDAEGVLVCAARAGAHWVDAPARGRAGATRLTGLGHHLREDYGAAAACYREVLAVFRADDPASVDVAVVLNDLAGVERHAGEHSAAETGFREALRIARAVGSRDGVVNYTVNLAALALARKDWAAAETLAREALALAEALGRRELIAADNHCLAHALLELGRRDEALPHAQRAVEIFTALRSPTLAEAQATLTRCTNKP